MIAKSVKSFFNNKLIQSLNNKNRTKIYIYPNLNGFVLGLFIFFCFLIAVFYENNCYRDRIKESETTIMFKLATIQMPKCKNNRRHAEAPKARRLVTPYFLRRRRRRRRLWQLPLIVIFVLENEIMPYNN